MANHDTITRLMLEYTEVDGERLQPHWVDGFWVDDEWYGGYLEWTLRGWGLAGKPGPVEYGALELIDRKIVPFKKVVTLTNFYRQADAQRRRGESIFRASHYSRSELSNDQLSRIEKSKRFNEKYDEAVAQSTGLGCAVWIVVIAVVFLMMIQG